STPATLRHQRRRLTVHDARSSFARDIASAPSPARGVRPDRLCGAVRRRCRDAVCWRARPAIAGGRLAAARDARWAWTLRGYGMWVVEELGSGAFVGRVGLHYPEGWPEPEVAWALASAYWGRGYALEAATAALRIAFETLGWSRAISLIAPLNLRSIRLTER